MTAIINDLAGVYNLKISGDVPQMLFRRGSGCAQDRLPREKILWQHGNDSETQDFSVVEFIPSICEGLLRNDIEMKKGLSIRDSPSVFSVLPKSYFCRSFSVFITDSALFLFTTAYQGFSLEKQTHESFASAGQLVSRISCASANGTRSDEGARLPVPAGGACPPRIRCSSPRTRRPASHLRTRVCACRCGRGTSGRGL